MTLPEICIRRPVFATVLSLVLLLVGLVSFDRLTVREYPKVDEPVVSVHDRAIRARPRASSRARSPRCWRARSPASRASTSSNSTSRAELSRITIRFSSTVNPDAAASDVRDRVSRVRGRLPDEIDEPIIAKVEADAQPIIFIAFASDRMNALELTDYVDRYVVDRLKNLTGVSDVTIFGERRYAMRIWIDRGRLAAYNLTVQDVESALR